MSGVYAGMYCTAALARRPHSAPATIFWFSRRKDPVQFSLNASLECSGERRFGCMPIYLYMFVMGPYVNTEHPYVALLAFYVTPGAICLKNSTRSRKPIRWSMKSFHSLNSLELHPCSDRVCLSYRDVQALLEGDISDLLCFFEDGYHFPLSHIQKRIHLHRFRSRTIRRYPLTFHFRRATPGSNTTLVSRLRGIAGVIFQFTRIPAFWPHLLLFL